MVRDELDVGVTVQVPSEGRQGEIYRLPSEDVEDEIQVMLLDEDGLYEYVITGDEEDFEVLET